MHKTDSNTTLLTTMEDAAIRSAVHITNCFGKSLTDIGIEYKVADGDTPRTIIDTNVETAIKEYLFSSPFKNEIGFVGEEQGTVGGKRNFKVWADPFDGTSNAAINLGMSVIGMGVEENGELKYALILNPFEKTLISGAIGQGVFVQNLQYDPHSGFSRGTAPQKLSIVNPSSSKERYAWVDALWNAKTGPRKSGWLNDIAEHALNVRMTGSNIDYSAKLAQGRGHIQLTDAIGGFFDIAPGIVFVTELGGKFTDIYGNTPKDGCQVAVACTDPHLHDKILGITQKHYGKDSPLGEYKGFR